MSVLAGNLHAVVLQSSSLELNKNTQLNKGHFAERLTMLSHQNSLLFYISMDTVARASEGKLNYF